MKQLIILNFGKKQCDELWFIHSHINVNIPDAIYIAPHKGNLSSSDMRVIEQEYIKRIGKQTYKDGIVELLDQGYDSFFFFPLIASMEYFFSR